MHCNCLVVDFYWLCSQSSPTVSSPTQYLEAPSCSFVPHLSPCFLSAGHDESGSQSQCSCSSHVDRGQLPCPALPCPALPCPALPCPALPCPALPCPACSISRFLASLPAFTERFQHTRLCLTAPECQQWCTSSACYGHLLGLIPSRRKVLYQTKEYTSKQS